MNIFAHKLKIAIFDNTNNSSNKDKIFDLLKKMFGGKVLIEFYSDTKEMFVALNIAKAKNKPFIFQTRLIIGMNYISTDKSYVDRVKTQFGTKFK